MTAGIDWVNNPSSIQQSPHLAYSEKANSKPIRQPPIAASVEVVPSSPDETSAVEGDGSISSTGEPPPMTSRTVFNPVPASEASGK